MPGNVRNSVPSGLMPYSLCTAFAESREFVQLRAQYHDATTERSQLAASWRTHFPPHKAPSAAATTLKTFWDGQQGGPRAVLTNDFTEGASKPSANSTPAGSIVALRRQQQPCIRPTSSFTMPATSDTETVAQLSVAGRSLPTD